MKKCFSQIVLAVLLSLCGIQPALAQLRFEHFRLIDESMGLPVNDVRAICKDETGFMWFATREGLCRFDGRHFKTYKNDPDDPGSLFDNQIGDVVSYKGKIWAATQMGISVLDPKTERFSHYQFDSFSVIRTPTREVGRIVTKLYVDPHGTLWCGTQSNGICRYLPKQDSFQFFAPGQLRKSRAYYNLNNDFRILSLVAARHNDSIVYAGTVRGLIEVNQYTGSIKINFYPDNSPRKEEEINVFRRIYIHDDSLLYSGRWTGGVYVYNPKDKTHRPIPLKDNYGAEMLVNVSNFTRKSADEFWISTGGGLICYNVRQQRITYIKKHDLEFGALYGIDFIDESQRVWFPILNGVALYDPCQQQVVSYSYKKLRPPGESYGYYILPGSTDNEVLLLPRNDDALYHFDLETHQYDRVELRLQGKNNIHIDQALGFSKAPDGTYTILGQNGIVSYEPETRKFRPFNFKPPADFYSLRNVYWDRSGQLWISELKSTIYRWNPKTNQTRKFYDEFIVPEAPEHPPMVERVWEDSKGHFWFRRTGGFSVYLPEKDQMFNFLYEVSPDKTLANNHSMAEDQNGRMWMAGPDGWLGYAEVDHPEKGMVRKFNLREKLGLTYIYFIAVDHTGTLWGITNKELVYADTKKMEFHTLGFEYAGGTIDFFSLENLPQGEIIIGGRNSLYVFDPTSMKRNTEMPKPYIEEIQVKGKPLPAIPQINGRPGLQLRYWENDFAITFSAIAYTLGEKCKFRYRLRGQEDWQDAKNRRFVNYTNVRGGDYFFEVQVANNEGIWSPSVLEMPVRVATAWWVTWWFKVLIIIGVLALAYGVYRYRILQVRREERFKSVYEKRLANVEMSALLAQMNPHFLFNSLNSIDSYIIRNESRKASEYLNNFARLMRLILNNSRTNYISLSDELEALDLYLQMESLRFKDKFAYEIIVDENLDTSGVSIPPMLIQPYIENAIWHGLMHKDSGLGKVTLRVNQLGDNLECVIEDNGVGRTYAMELSSKRSGNKRQSMGMKITEDRIEIINKLYDANTRVQIIDLYDDAGNATGTRVVLTIPV
ncbi:MAG: histidine kinase [Lewinellaceae bacterium]|nr:histidine kinase [Saprospiraceae bacterium]MCB9329509.1 histidine kinase [Lewinellaceae bacterium]